jgi:hypothetical protein
MIGSQLLLNGIFGVLIFRKHRDASLATVSELECKDSLLIPPVLLISTINNGVEVSKPSCPVRRLDCLCNNLNDKKKG